MLCFHWQITQEMCTVSMRGAYCHTLPTTSRTGAGSTGFISIVPPAKLFNPPYCPFYLVFLLLVPIQLLPRYDCAVELKQLFPIVVYCWQFSSVFPKKKKTFCCCLASVKVGVCVCGRKGCYVCVCHESRVCAVVSSVFWWLQCVSLI